MKKTIFAVVAAAALAAAGAASAQGGGEVLGRLYGYGQPHVSGPVEVMGQQPSRSTVYMDTQGRQVAVGLDGRQTVIAEGQRPVVVAANTDDADKDGVANANDRWPFDRRYW